MQKQLTITLDEQVYEGLYQVIGQQYISQFIEWLVRPHVIGTDLESAYRNIALDEFRELEALEWAEVTVGDVSDETIYTDLESAYRNMALDESREIEALEWAEATIGDVCYETTR